MTTIERPTTNAVAALFDSLDRIRKRPAIGWDLLWSRSSDWVKPVLPAGGERGGGSSAPSDRDLLERKEDRAASRIHDEARAIVVRMRADAERLDFLWLAANPDMPRKIEGRDMLASQVAAAGLCVSCWRYGQTNKEREKDAKGSYYDREACRRCAGFKREHGVYPPLPLLEMWHGRGKLNWTTALVEQALAEGKKR